MIHWLHKSYINSMNFNFIYVFFLLHIVLINVEGKGAFYWSSYFARPVFFYYSIIWMFECEIHSKAFMTESNSYVLKIQKRKNLSVVQVQYISMSMKSKTKTLNSKSENWVKLRLFILLWFRSFFSWIVLRVFGHIHK